MGITLIVFLTIILILMANSIHMLQAYERAAILRLGRFVGVKGPGIILITPFIDKIIKIKLGMSGEALSNIDAYKGKISLDGKEYNAVSEKNIEKGEKITVAGIEEKEQFENTEEETKFVIKVKKKEV